MPAPKGTPLWKKQRPLERYQIQRDGDVKGPFDSENDSSQKQKMKGGKNKRNGGKEAYCHPFKFGNP